MKKLFFLLILMPLNLWAQSNGTRLIGKVLDEDNKGLRGVTVYLNHKPEIPAVTGGSHGAFEIPTLNISITKRIFLKVEKKGYYLANAFDGNLFEVTPQMRKVGYITIKMRKVPQLNEKPKLALLPFCNFGEPNSNLLERAFVAPIRRGLTEVDTAKIEVLPYSAVKVALAKHQFTAQDYCNYDKIFAIGNELHANIVITGAYQYFGDRLQVDCEFTQMHPTQDFKDPIFISQAKNTLPSIQNQLTLEIIKRFGVQTSTAEQQNIASWTSESTKNADAFENFANGLQESDDGNYENAEKQFKKSLEKDNQNARAWQQQGAVQLIQGKEKDAQRSLENAESLFFNFDYIDKYISGIARARKGNKWGYIDTKNQIVVPFLYDEIQLFNNVNLATVKQNGQYGFVNRLGEVIIPIEYNYIPIITHHRSGQKRDTITNFPEGLLRINKNGKYGFINSKGETVIPFMYDYAQNFSSGLAAVQNNGLWGFIDKQNKNIIKFKYPYAMSFNGNVAPVRNDKWGFIDKKGKLVMNFQYDAIHSMMTNKFQVSKDGKKFYINDKGVCVQDCP